MYYLYKTYEGWWGNTIPEEASGDASAVTLALRYRFDADCWLIGCRFFRDEADGGDHLAIVRNEALDTIIRVALFHRVAASGVNADRWHSVYFPKRLWVAAGTVLGMCVWHSAGLYWRSRNHLNSGDLTDGNLTQVQDTPTYFNGLFSYGADLAPNQTYQSSQYGIDPIIWLP